MGEIEIKVWMTRNKLNARKIADNYHSSEQFVGQFLKGRKTSKGLVDYLINRGCPEKHFNNGRVAE